MPFYFALPKLGNVATQRRQETGRVDFNRSEPSGIAYVAMSVVTRAESFIVENLHAVLASAIGGTRNGFKAVVRPDVAAMPVYQHIPSSIILPFSTPDMSLRIEGDGIEEAEAILLDAGFDKRGVKGKGELFVGSLTAEAQKKLEKFYMDPDVNPIGGTLSGRGYQAFKEIVRLISSVASALDLGCDKHDGKGVRLVEWGDYVKKTFQVHNISEFAVVKEEAEYSFLSTIPSKSVTDVMALEALRPVFGGISDLPDNLTFGIFCPFEPNYSKIDKMGLPLFMSDFYAVCGTETEFQGLAGRIQEFWISEISATMEGEFLAHAMAVLRMAKKTHSQPFFLFTNNVYEGAVIHGAEKFVLHTVSGGSVEAMSKEQIQEDIRKYVFHTAALTEIIERMRLGPDATPDNITSMRVLREQIWGKNNFAITPADKTWLMKKALFLNFREKPETVNIGSLRRFFSYIHPTNSTPIPPTVYLDRSALLSTDPIEVALSMFGRFAPSPNSSGRVYTCAVPASSNADKVSPEPTYIKFVFKKLEDSASDWKGFLNGGKMVYPDAKLKRGRAFRTEEKTELWGQLKSLAAAGIMARKSEKQASADKGKRKEREETESITASESSAGPPKKKKMSFAAFGDLMDTE